MPAPLRTIAATAIALVLAVALGQGLQSLDRPDLGFSIAYPVGWQVSESNEGGETFFVLAPAPGTQGSGEVAVEILLGAGMAGDLDSAVAQVLQELFANFPGFRETQRFDIVLAGLPAKLVEVRGLDQGQNDVIWQLAFVISGDRGYLVILEALSASFAGYQPLLEQILGSFALGPAQGSLAGTPGGQQPGQLPQPGAVTPPAGGNPGPIGNPGQTAQPTQPGQGNAPAAQGQPQPSGDFGPIALGESRSAVLAPIPDQNSLVFHTYVVEVPPGTPSLAVRVDGGGADIDLAIRVGAPIESYDDVDFLDASEEPNPAALIPNPPPGPVYIDVINLLPTPGPYTLFVGVDGAAPAPGAGNPLGPATPGANPLAPAQDPFVGAFGSDALTVELDLGPGGYQGRILFGQQVFLLSATASGATLNGTFQSGTDQFQFVATLAGTTLTFETGGQTYVLQKLR